MKKEGEVLVFHDGGCPMCSREINHYRGLLPFHPVRWIDVTDRDIDLSPWGISVNQAMQRFHVVDQQGVLHTGADAFVTLWAVLPGYRWLARVCRGLGLVPMLEVVYRRFSAWHFRRRCRDGVCGLDDSRGLP